MNSSEYLLVTLGEECAEVQQAISKILRFGWDRCGPATPGETNEERLMTELCHLEAMVEMLMEEDLLHRMPEDEARAVKRSKKSRVTSYRLWHTGFEPAEGEDGPENTILGRIR